MTHTRTRSAFTLVELLVAMSIIAALSAIAILAYPAVTNQDKVRSGVELTTSSLKLAQAMAARDGRPRGVRLLVTANAAKPRPELVTELQLIELPPVFVPNRTPLATANSLTTDQRVVFTYTIAPAGSTSPPQGTITSRDCRILNLTADEAVQIVAGTTLILPTLGSWHKIIAVGTPQPAASAGRFDLTVTLEVYPDAQLGAAIGDPNPNTPQTGAVMAGTFYHFGVYGTARPLLGEKLIPLPTNICIDLGISLPPSNASVDILFAPNGQMIRGVNNASGQLFLWVRDYNKVATIPLGTPAQLPAAFRSAGEMQAVGIRAGTIGAAPITWPDTTNGTYPAGQDPFFFARQELSGP